jgi:predicted amidohydrolase
VGAYIESKGNGKDAYTVDPVSKNLIPRVTQALEALDESGCPLALLPEAALDDDLLAAWVSALRNPARAVGLQWILVGTGPVTTMGSAVPPKPPRPNRAVVLTSDGEVVFTQDKRAGFTLDAIQIKRYELSEKLGISGPLNEYIRKGSRLTVIDNSSGRFAIAICEDHGRVIENGHLSQAIGLTHLLVPVIAPAMWSGGWQSSAAQTLASGCGISVAVSNSIAINQQGQDASGTTTGPAPTLCVVRAPHAGPVASHGMVSWEMKAHPRPLADPVDDSLTVRTTTL